MILIILITLSFSSLLATFSRGALLQLFIGVISFYLISKKQINVIRIKQEDIWKDKNNWQQSIIDAITMLFTLNHHIPKKIKLF